MSMATLVKNNVQRVWMWLAKYMSSSRTETPMWYGLTQSIGWEHSVDFSSLSLSVLSSGIALNRITITRSRRQTLSAWRRQSIRRIFPFWSGFEMTHSVFAAIPPVLMHCMKPSRQSCTISFCSFASNCIAHFWRTSTASRCQHMPNEHCNHDKPRPWTWHNQQWWGNIWTSASTWWWGLTDGVPSIKTHTL